MPQEKQGTPKTPNSNIVRQALDTNFEYLIQNPDEKEYQAAQMASRLLSYIDEIVQSEINDSVVHYEIMVTAKKDNDSRGFTPTIRKATGEGHQLEAVQEVIEELGSYAHTPKGTENQHSLRVEIGEIGIYFQYLTQSDSEPSSFKAGVL